MKIQIKKYHVRKESCGIRSISRIMKISSTTVIKRIQEIAKKTERLNIMEGKEYEMDEMHTFIKNKENKFWIACA